MLRCSSLRRFQPSSWRMMCTAVPPEKIRNVAIIAHVDHGKTTLVDGLLSNSGQKIVMNERKMDSNELEKERGITIMSKCTSIDWRGHLVNIVDTPGHSDFGGEVERVLSMVDGVALVVDATDGPMTQTKFVLSKALEKGLHPIVVVNKVDRPTSRLDEVDMDLYELFEELGATEAQLGYSTVYASAKEGWAVLDMATDKRENLHALLDLMLSEVPPPDANPNAPFSMLVNQLDSNDFLGRCLLGRVHSGTIRTGDTIHALDPEGKVIEECKVLKLFGRRGIDQVVVSEASAGQIVSVAGFPLASVSATLAAPDVLEPLPSSPIDPPTVAINLSANTSPLFGNDGTKVSTDDIRERLRKECELSVALQCDAKDSADSFLLKGRGELQLGIVLENMRREGFELSVSPPEVLMKESEDGHTLEPIEELVIDVDNDHAGTVIEKLTKRLGMMQTYEPMPGSDSRSKIVFEIPSRGLLGFRPEFVNDTRGTGVMSSVFVEYRRKSGDNVTRSSKGAIVAVADGRTTRYSLETADKRGILFVGEGEDVYEGMVIGENSRELDMEVNPVKAKALNNMRASGKDEAVRLAAPKKMTLEDYLAYCREDEIIEVTPNHIRLRKRILDASNRKRSRK